MRAPVFWLIIVAVGLAFIVVSRLYLTNEYFYFAGYVVLEYIVLSTAWNILGGYTGYTNFGTGAFFAMGAYSSAVLHKLPALLLGVVENITATFYGPSWSPAVAFGFLLLTLAFRPTGIMGR